jgi:pyruvate/2-oxoglutarate/acetoin dehydrogenase E1 component
MSYAKAVNAALDRCLTDMPETLLFGEDVAVPGGVFGCTRDLADRHGHRVFDTPISESAILGLAVGAAMLGQRPVAEIMWVDFSLVALDQIVNQAANIRYCSNGTLAAPLTIRTQQGALPGSCAQHSQCLEAFFAHVPGLRVAMPAMPQDAYDLLCSAIACDDPVVVIEARSLYQSAGEVELGRPVQAIGGARIARAGDDATLVALGTMLDPALEAAAELGERGCSVEVLDPRWLAPLDVETIVESAERTGRLVIAHEANVVGGFGAEIAATVAEHGIWSLDAPIKRVGAANTRMPSAPHLQQSVLPAAANIMEAVAAVLPAEALRG